MKKQCYLATYAVKKRDKAFLVSMLEMLQTQLDAQWHIDETQTHCVLVDIDEPKGLDYWHQQKNNSQCIVFSIENKVNAEWFLAKPLRLKNITELLNQWTKSKPNIFHSQPTVVKTAVAQKHPLENIIKKPEINFLALLQKARTQQNNICFYYYNEVVIYAPLPKPHCLVSFPVGRDVGDKEKAFYASPRHMIKQRNITVAEMNHLSTTHQLSPCSVETLLWNSTLLTSNGKLHHDMKADIHFHLKHWPNFKLLSHNQQHLYLAAFMLKNNRTLNEVMRETRMTMDKVIDFFNACYTIGLVVLDDATRQHHKPLLHKKQGLFRSILTRLSA